MSNGTKDYHREWLQAYTKFNYFIVGLTAAILSFSLQFFRINEFDRLPWLLPAAWTYLTIALFAGIKTIERGVSALASEVLLLQQSGVVEPMKTAMIQARLMPRIRFVDRGTGEPLSPDVVEANLQKSEEVLELLKDSRSKWSRRAEIYYAWRNWFFFTGFFTIVIAHVLNFR